ncbi:GTPase activating protein and centrosome-associated [Dermatophagoides pteronyssinus]|uniref:Rab GTPase-activating protein 1-like n=1 Tax=Dermatophagoides pteronyssinus TaxID=6956 RepID=A0A6P6XTW5_DERPT|nr:rab GTPase-activating protein 1-like [Dermatophagoides pteronyssinus]
MMENVNEIPALHGDDYHHHSDVVEKPLEKIDVDNNSINNNNNNNENGNEKMIETKISKSEQSLSDNNKQSYNKTFMYQIRTQLLGIRFLQNERKGFEQEVERSMHKLKVNHEMNAIDNGDLPEILINIPHTINDFVIIEFVNKTMDDEKLFSLIQKCNEEFFDNLHPNDVQIVRDALLIHPIRILVNQLFLYRGQLNTPVERCLTMTTIFSLLSSPSTAKQRQQNRYQQCLIAQFESPAQVTDVLNVFRKLHGIMNQFQPLSTNIVVSRVNEYKIVMNAEVEIQEEISDGKWQTCPREKDSFKIRTNIDKRIIINLQQDLTHYNFPMIRIERCFGMLLSPGRNVSPNQMVAIGLNSMSSSIPNPETAPTQSQWQIVASWIPTEIDSDHLNTETTRSSRVYFTIALDLILENIEEPIRFIFESKAKIIPTSISATEKFWKNLANLSKNSQHYMHESFSLIVRQRPDMHGRIIYDVISCLSSTQIAMQKQRLSLQLNLNKISESSKENSTPTPSSPLPEEEQQHDNNNNDDDEPLQSGSGSVRRECSQNEIQAWHNIMEKWNKENLSVRPRQLANMIRRGGIPQALRPEIWQLLSGAHEIEEKILPKYKLFVTQESSYESIILRDISRTFTAHEKFRDSGSDQQESLFRICKAYSNYDSEIGYCQGLSYLIAALLLNMPEEQAFLVLIQIMYRYGLRDLFKSGLENLHCKFYQLERLLDEQIPELYCHFIDLHIEAHMYASQWFLTLFTTKFPLNVVFRIIDLFLLDEMDVILQIALGLLQMSKNDLLALDFEGIMKYFRVTLPKIYRVDDSAAQLIKKSIKINVKKSKKYEAQFKEWQEKNRDPLEILQTENKRLMQTVARLEQENDDQAMELIGLCQSKIRMKIEVDRAEDKADTLNNLLLQTRTKLVDSDDDRKQLNEELKNLKDKYRHEIDRFELETKNERKIIEEYKQICKNYQEKYEKCREDSNKMMEKILNEIKTCQNCTEIVRKIMHSETDNSIDQNNHSSNGQIEEEQDKAKQDLYRRIVDLESELIKTKIALAESEDRNGQLMGKLHSTTSELNLLKAENDERAAMANNTWFTKTLLSFRDATNSSSSSSSSTQTKHVKQSNSISSGIASSLSNESSLNNSQQTNQTNNNEPQKSNMNNKFRRNSSQSEH